MSTPVGMHKTNIQSTMSSYLLEVVFAAPPLDKVGKGAQRVGLLSLRFCLHSGSDLLHGNALVEWIVNQVLVDQAGLAEVLSVIGTGRVCGGKVAAVAQAALALEACESRTRSGS